MRKATIIAVLPLLLLFCAKKPTNVPDDFSIQYHVEIPSMGLDSLQIRVTVSGWQHGDSVRFATPPMYADNPMLSELSQNFSGLTIKGMDSSIVAFSTDSIKVGPKKAYAFAFHREMLPVDITYDVKFNYAGMPGIASHMPVPNIGPNEGILLGNYLFIVPYWRNAIPAFWRDRFSLIVYFAPDPSLRFYGDPVSGVHFRNAYELLFSTNVLGGNLIAEGQTGGQRYRMISVDTLTSISPSMTAGIKDALQTLVGDIVSVFPAFGGSRAMTVISGAMKRDSGLEGTHAFSISPPFPDDSLGVFNMILSHEILHFWIGVRVGEYDDPWWKEGTTNYLGFLFAAKNDLCTQSLLVGNLLQDLSGDYSTLNRALSDPFVRDNLFADDSLSSCINLVYKKGGQVSMMIDRAIREATGNARTYPGVLAAFVRRYDGEAFHRNGFLGYVQNRTGVDLTSIFAKYVDQPGIIPSSVLNENYNALVMLGAFGTNNVPKRSARITMPQKLSNMRY